MPVISPTITAAGRFQIIAKTYTPTSYSWGTTTSIAEYDITFVRNVPTEIVSYSHADPFGSATALIRFPGVSGFDGPNTLPWLTEFTDIDIYWVPITPNANGWIIGLDGTRYSSSATITQGGQIELNRIPVWAGYIASLDVTTDSQGFATEAQCQGAVYQLDRYTQKPWYPPRPWSVEGVIEHVFLKTQDYRFHLPIKADLRVDYLGVTWPVGWSKYFVIPRPPLPDTLYDAFGYGPPYDYNYWTGYGTRNTGDWSKCLTGFVQDLLGIMYTTDDCGVTSGNQWTLGTPRYKSNTTIVGDVGGSISVNDNPLRQPELYVRERFNPFIHFDVTLGTPGLEVNLQRDSTQFANAIYGEGVGIDGTVWRNAVVTYDGAVTQYAPLAVGTDVHLVENTAPSDGVTDSLGQAYDDSYYYSDKGFISEAYYKYGSNFGQEEGISAAAKAAQRDGDAGWSGTIKLKFDPARNTTSGTSGSLWGTTVTQDPPFYDSSDTTSTVIPRFLMRGGMTMRLRGWQGNPDGIVLHIAEVQVNVQDLSVDLKVDTRFRDLLTLEEALARTRDPLTPTKLLQVGKRTGLVEDNLAPWDYKAGSGFMTKASREFHIARPQNLLFPYETYTRSRSPSTHPQYYIKVPANAGTTLAKWSAPFPILMGAKGTISRIELCAYDAAGNVLPVEFHFSFYYTFTPATTMPHIGSNFDPFQDGLWYEMSPTGVEWPVTGAGSEHRPPQYMINGWGNFDQRAGYSPGLYSLKTPKTGKLIDDGSFTWDMLPNKSLDFDVNAAPGMQKESAVTAWGMIYCNYSSPVYFMGRLFRANPGV